VPILGLYGGNDDGIPVATVEQMRSQSWGNTSSIVLTLTRRTLCRLPLQEKQAEDGWKRLQAWFKQHGVSNENLKTQFS